MSNITRAKTGVAKTNLKTKMFLKSFTFLYVVCIATCSLKDELRQKVQEIKNKGKELYGEAKKNNTKSWEYQLEDQLAYPKSSDKWKLNEVSDQWASYYSCLVRGIDNSNTTTAQSLMTYVGMTLRLNCTICLSPEGKNEYDWWYSKSTRNTQFSPLEYQDNMATTEDGALTIYSASAEDSGTYLCRLGATNGSFIFVETVDQEEKYIVVKNRLASTGPYAQPDVALTHSGLILYNKQGEWSACSNCGKVGRRRKLAICYLRLRSDVVRPEQFESADDVPTTNDDVINVSNNTIELLKVFPEGIPCRSKLLPEYLLKEPIIKDRHSEIMIGLCKIPCVTNLIFEVRSQDGRILERANNSAGVYSLLQSPPLQPPPPATDILFPHRQHIIKILCPGSLMTDAPYKWKIGSQEVIPRIIDQQSRGRMYISARDQLVITSLRLTDSNVYSCWQKDRVAGVVKLVVSESKVLRYDKHLTLLGLAVISAVVLRLAVRALRNKQRHITML